MSLFLPGTSARAFDDTQDLSPWSVEKYLELSGWSQEELRAGTFAVWISEDEDAEILLPYDIELRDFSRRYREALHTLTEITGLRGEALALEIVAARKDVFLLRADQLTLDGSIPFLEAKRLVDGVETLLATAAASTVNPRASTAGRKSSLVNEFLREDVRLGHTLHGSFVITVLAADASEESRQRAAWLERINNPTPVPANESQLDRTDDDMTPFPRQVMSTLASGLSVASELFSSGATVSTEEAIQAGVTLQLLESVKDMSQSEGLRALDMAFKWSKVDPIELDVPQRIEVRQDSTANAASLIERFSKVPDVEDDEIVGKVIRLDRAEGSEDGQVIVEGFVGKSKRKVKVALSGDSYRAAISAHDTSATVLVRGRFERKSRGWRMKNPLGIEFVHGATTEGDGER